MSEAADTIARAEADALAAIEAASDVDEVREAEVRALGRKAPMSVIRGQMRTFSEDERREIGRLLSDARARIEAAIETRRAALAAAEEAAVLERDRVDVSLPGRTLPAGGRHPTARVIERIVDVFVGMGYRVAEGPEVESDWYNFEALNMPPDHPARSMWDTLYVDGTDLLLRTHTSPVQVRAMQAQEPPIYVLSPGRVFRRDAWDASHASTFAQIEGLAIDRGITLADLKGTLAAFAREIFGPDQRVRFRPSYFPFTEPSAEVDVRCVRCGGDGCAACGRSGWIEIMGAGMVHPSVLDAVGWDPKIWSGFAFGMGPDRIAMRVYGIDDIRVLFENDQRFLAGVR